MSIQRCLLSFFLFHFLKNIIISRGIFNYFHLFNHSLIGLLVSLKYIAFQVISILFFYPHYLLLDCLVLINFLPRNFFFSSSDWHKIEKKNDFKMENFDGTVDETDIYCLLLVDTLDSVYTWASVIRLFCQLSEQPKIFFYFFSRFYVNWSIF